MHRARISRNTSPSVAHSNTFTFLSPAYRLTFKVRLDSPALPPVTEGDPNAHTQLGSLNLEHTQATLAVCQYCTPTA